MGFFQVNEALAELSERMTLGEFSVRRQIITHIKICKYRNTQNLYPLEYQHDFHLQGRNYEGVRAVSLLSHPSRRSELAKSSVSWQIGDFEDFFFFFGLFISTRETQLAFFTYFQLAILSLKKCLCYIPGHIRPSPRQTRFIVFV